MSTWQSVLSGRWRAQQASNRTKLAEHQGTDETEDEERLLTHLASFSQEIVAKRAEAHLRLQGFNIRATRLHGQYQLIFRRVDTLLLPTVDRVTYDILLIVSAYNGQYHGWSVSEEASDPP